MGDGIVNGEEGGENADGVEGDSLPPPPLIHLSRRDMTDWSVVISAISLMMLSSLLIANACCSFVLTGIFDSTTMCVGGSLSIQSWLAVVGDDFSFLCAIVLPRAEDITVRNSSPTRWSETIS
jgi:hypothetical protein